VKTVCVLVLLLLAASPPLSGETVQAFETLSERREALPLASGGGVSSNSAIDIMEHNGGVILATSDGLNYSLDGGLTWQVFDVEDGLPSDNVSAVYSGAGRLWAATNRSSLIGGIITTLSDGVSYSLDNGASWTQIDFSEDGQDIDYVWGGDRVIYDVTGHSIPSLDKDWVFFAAFAGGLLGSPDGGQTWKRIFRVASDSLQFLGSSEPELNNRFFACRADSSHGDSLFLWVGTAGGLFQYVFAPRTEKLFSRWYLHASFCDECGADSSFIFIGGDNGVSRIQTSGKRPYLHRAVDAGLRGPYTSALIDFRGRVLVGSRTDSVGNSEGLAYSDDLGDTYTPLTAYDAYFAGAGHAVSDFAAIGERLYLAAEGSGLFVSLDTGLTWERILVDSSDQTAANGRNTVHALLATGDTLRVGTDSGLVSLYMNATGVIDSSRGYVFTDSDTSAARVVKIREQVFVDTTTALVDSTVLFTVNRPIESVGTLMIGRSNDGGRTFSYVYRDEYVYDVNFRADTVLAMGDGNARYRVDFGPASGDFWTYYRVEQYSGGDLRDRLVNDVVTSLEYKGDTMLFLSSNGIALSNDNGESYTITRPNLDAYRADLIVLHTTNYTDLVGDWCIAIAVEQPRGPEVDNNLSRVWISTRPTYLGSNGVSRGRYVPVTDAEGDTTAYTIDWELVYDDYAWNIAFNGDSVFLATDAGLVFGEIDAEDEVTWDTIALVDTLGQALVLPGSPAYGVEVVDDYLWVGTSDRTVRMALDSPAFSDKESYYVVDTTSAADEVYAFPVPFSHTYSQAVEFHFTVESETNVTLEVYDFAMNLVARVIDNEMYPAGVYPQAGGLRRTWDGRNGNGDAVAVGVYYFKVEYSSGDARWGKLAIMP